MKKSHPSLGEVSAEWSRRRRKQAQQYLVWERLRGIRLPRLVWGSFLLPFGTILVWWLVRIGLYTKVDWMRNLNTRTMEIVRSWGAASAKGSASGSTDRAGSGTSSTSTSPRISTLGSRNVQRNRERAARGASPRESLAGALERILGGAPR